MIDQQISQKRLLLQDQWLRESEMNTALEYCFDYIGHASREWLESNYEHRLRLQKLIFEKPIPFDGEKLGTPELSLIYKLKETSHGEKTLLVAHKRPLSNLLTRAHEFAPQITAWNREIRPVLTMEPRPQTVVVTYRYMQIQGKDALTDVAQNLPAMSGGNNTPSPAPNPPAGSVVASDGSVVTLGNQAGQNAAIFPANKGSNSGE